MVVIADSRVVQIVPERHLDLRHVMLVAIGVLVAWSDAPAHATRRRDSARPRPDFAPCRCARVAPPTGGPVGATRGAPAHPRIHV